MRTDSTVKTQAAKPWPVAVIYIESFFWSYYIALSRPCPKLNILIFMGYIIYKNLSAALLQTASRVDAKAG